MDSYEATKMVFSRIQSLEPENASKIMGYLLIQDHGEKEMIRLAYGPETFLQNLILKAKTQLGLAVPTKSPSAPSTPSSTSSFNPISRPNSLSLLSSSSRITNNGFDFTNPSSPSSSAWHLSGFSDPRSLNNPRSPSSTCLLSYASVVTRTSTNNTSSGSACGSSACGHIDDTQLREDYNRCFVNDSRTEDLFSPRLDLASAYDDLQKQNYAVPGMLYESEDVNSGFGWKPCLYFARGFCKNGSFCRFLHGDSSSSDGTSIVGSPNNNLNELEQCQDLLRRKAAAQQQRMASASQFMTTGTSFPYSQCIDLLAQQQIDTQRCRSAAAALMVGDEFQKFSRCRFEKNEFSAMNSNPGSRQIYLTFPADSSFREEDVSNYFSIYGPVQDVRIPYQQKRMFGFVTFLYPETVKLILAKGNPHFVCDSRVLVKPYKEKGKILDKKQQHQYLDRGDYSMCSSPTGLDCHGERMFYSTQDMLLAKKLEERANLQQAVELQGRRLMNLQLQDLKNQSCYGQQYQYDHGLPTESSMPSPVLSWTPHNQTSLFSPNGTHQQVLEEENGSPSATLQLQQDVNPSFNLNNGKKDERDKEYCSNAEESDVFESIEHILPDSLFASPKKSAGHDHAVIFSTASMEANESTTTATDSSASSNNGPVLPSTSTLSVAPPESVFSNSTGFLLGMEPLECS